MSDFVLNDAGMKAFIRGPITRDLERRARNVRDEAKENVRGIMHRLPSVQNSVKYKIEVSPLRAEIGIIQHASEKEPKADGTFKDSIEDYLAAKEVREGGVWLQPALRAARLRK